MRFSVAVALVAVIAVSVVPVLTLMHLLSLYTKKQANKQTKQCTLSFVLLKKISGGLWRSLHASHQECRFFFCHNSLHFRHIKHSLVAHENGKVELSLRLISGL